MTLHCGGGNNSPALLQLGKISTDTRRMRTVVCVLCLRISIHANLYSFRPVGCSSWHAESRWLNSAERSGVIHHYRALRSYERTV